MCIVGDEALVVGHDALHLPLLPSETYACIYMHVYV